MSSQAFFESVKRSLHENSWRSIFNSKVFGRGEIGQKESPFLRRLTCVGESWIFDGLITVIIGGSLDYFVINFPFSFSPFSSSVVPSFVHNLLSIYPNFFFGLARFLKCFVC